jgi:hypothetical protein
MSDIFISYKKEDAGRVVRIVEALRAEGFSVWWDHGIAPGAQWDKTIQSQLDMAKAVVAVWSIQSRDAPWVKEESAVGKNRGILVPIRIDDVEPPLGFTLIQASDLVSWSGDVKDPRWIHFTGALRGVLSGERAVGVDAPLRKRKGARVLAWAVGALALIGLAAAAYLALTPRPAPTVVEVSVPQAPNGAPAPSGPNSAGPAGAQEKALFEQALSQKTRASWQSFLAAYPNSGLAQRARDALLMCRTEQRQTWKPSPVTSNTVSRGVGVVPEHGRTEAQACAFAKKEARDRFENICRQMGVNSPATIRNTKADIQDTSCNCNKTSEVSTVCVVDLPAVCAWESPVTDSTETCG